MVKSHVVVSLVVCVLFVCELSVVVEGGRRGGDGSEAWGYVEVRPSKLHFKNSSSTEYVPSLSVNSHISPSLMCLSV